jgi:hypothetical protein
MKKLLFFLSVAFSGMTGFAQAPTNGLLGYYGFNNTPNSHDGNFNLTNLNPTGTAVTYVVGGNGYGNAAHFDHNGLQNAAIASQVTSDFTIAFWQRATSATQETLASRFELFGSAYFRSQGVNFQYGVSNIMNIWTTGGTLSSVFPVNTWKHVALRFKTIGNTKEIALFINGVNDATITNISYNSNDIYKYNQVMTIGAGTTGAGLYSATKAFVGDVDEFYIYNRALLNSEIINVKNDLDGVPSVSIPIVSGITSLPSNQSATISYAINPNNTATTSIVRYGTTAGVYPNQVNGFSANGSNASLGSAFIAGLTPNTTYHFEVLATNVSGTTTPIYGFFTTTVSGGGLAYSLLAYYPFENNNNSYDNVHNLTIGNTNTTYNPTFATGKYGQGTDFGTGGGALINTSMNTVFNAGSYTISFWEKRTNNTIPFSTSFELFSSHYMRTGSSNTTSGFKITTSNIYAGANMNPAVYFNTWTHYAFVFGNSDAPLGGKFLKTYINGVLSGTSNGVMSNSDMLDKINNVICIGNGTNADGTINVSKAFTGMLDEFYIYNRALSVADINTLMTNSAGLTPLSNFNFNSNSLKASLYPNPATEILNIEIENELKSIEIYSLLGQKVLTSNSKQINVSSLSKGIYSVRIEDENNAVVTQKLLKE